ncbi:gamma-glutamyltransferase [Vibrio gallicus]|uniref:gamma-glutamyltransferase n=1 Tax=Vibrio gallicus TaxID=190897 RepID=UPI0021C3C26D|nr:gamma-glutamyltransferase [Vibrio gallicus]
MFKYFTLLCSGFILSFSVSANQTSEKFSPESSTGWQPKGQVTSRDWMVTAAHPIATQYAANVLNNGGNAADALVVVQLVLGLVEPQSSGIGGGGFMLYWDNQKQQLTSFDARETAPRAIKPNQFLDESGEALPFYDVVVSGMSVGTPGIVKLLWEFHQQHGKLKWPRLIEPIIELAEQGFEISPRLAKLIEGDKLRLANYPATKSYFLNPNGSPKRQGEVLKNPQYAETLKLLATYGENAFYQGDIADSIVKAVANHPVKPGTLSTQDLSQYRVIERPPICVDYLEYEVCGMGPPSSGGVTVAQIMKLTEPHLGKKFGPEDATSYQIIADATRLAFADRNLYVADSDYVAVPINGLVSTNYLNKRSALITPNKKQKQTGAGQPPWSKRLAYASDQSLKLPSTTHFNIIDSDGNVISMTSSIENVFGSRIMVKGFLLNNQLTDFSFKHHQNGKLIANHISPGKRPRSSMSPTIVLSQGKPYLAIGSPGGSYIIGYVAQALIAHLNWKMELSDTLQLPNISNRYGVFDIEQDTSALRFAPQFEKWGYKTNIRDLNSGIHVIKIEHNLTGAADPRREGTAIGRDQMGGD